MEKFLQIALLAGALVLVNVIAAQLAWQWDFTANRLYTLSDESRELLDTLEEPVTLHYYYSRSMPGLPVFFKNYAARIEELLKRYAFHSGGMVRLQTIDPQPDTIEEENARQAGILPRELPGGQAFYFGISATQGVREEVIPFLMPGREPLLEYDVTSLIYALQQPRKPTLALLTSLPMLGEAVRSPLPPHAGEPADMWAIVRELKKTYHIKRVRKHIPRDSDLLLVVHPRGTSTDMQFEIDQFAMTGKPVIIAVDPASLATLRSGRQANLYELQSDLPHLFKGWEIDYDPQKMVADIELAYSPNPGSDPANVAILDVRTIQPDFAGTSNLERVILPAAGAFRFQPREGVTIQPLMLSSANSNLIMASLIAESNAEQLRYQVMPEGNRNVLAIHLHGALPSAFPEGRPVNQENNPNAWVDELNAAEEERLIQPEKAVNILLFSDTDFLSDAIAVESATDMVNALYVPRNDNLALMLNLIDTLAGNHILPPLRSKTDTLRPFTVVETMRVDALQRYRKRIESLEQRLQGIQQSITQLRHQHEESGELVFSGDIQSSIESFRKDEIALQQERREIRKKLREDVESLKFTLATINLLTVPVLLLVLSIVYFSRRNRPRS